MKCGLIQDLSSSFPAYTHINKTIEVSRVHLFDIVTQYRAIFPDDDTMRISSSILPVGGGGDKVEGALFYSWINEKVGVNQWVWLPLPNLCIMCCVRFGSFCMFWRKI